jgi:o-succinylbenzoate---CoA ligase
MDWLRRAAEARPDGAAAIAGECTVSYAELDRAADGVASIVCGGGIEGGGVALWGDRTVETIAAFWGIMRAGVAPVLLDPTSPPDEQRRRSRSGRARGLWSPPDGGIERLAGRGDFVPPSSGFPEDEARAVLFTSGTEGEARPVVLTGSNVAASVAGTRDRLGNGPDDHWLCVLPLHHVGGLSILWRQAEQAAPVVLHDRFDEGAVAGALAHVAYASVVPTMLERVLAAGPHGGATLLVGGAPASADLIRRALRAGLLALQTYGMTETASQVCTVAPGRIEEEMGTVGRPIAGAEVRVVVADEPVVDVEGRIHVRGAMVSPGAPGEDREPGSWFVTGDVGVLDDAGRLTVAGRADRMIVTGGENVHPAAVEGVLESHPGVVRARVFGEPDDRWGQRVVAEVIVDGIGVGPLRRWVAERLAPAQVPKEIRPVDAIAGKLEE